MRHGSLFSGIGGFDLAAEWMGWENVFQVEKDEWCQKILKKNFPNVNRSGDIKEFKGTQRSVDIVSGGFPCQPFSASGKRKGIHDDRFLWKEMLRVISEIQPAWIVGENVFGIINWSGGLVFEMVHSDLETQGYFTQAYVLPSCGKGTIHKRERVFFIAYSASIGFGSIRKKNENNSCNKRSNEWRPKPPHLYIPIPRINLEAINRDDRMDDGLPYGMDRLRGIGNAVDPKVVFEIFKAIERYEKIK